MANYYGQQRQAYGIGQSLQGIFPAPIVTAGLNPTVNDHAEVGQTWFNTATNSMYALTSDAAGIATWQLMANSTSPGTGGSFNGTTITASGAITFSALTNGVITAGPTGILAAASMTDGQVFIGRTGNSPVAASLTAGSGISIAQASGSIIITATGTGITWATDANAAIAAVANRGYEVTNAGPVTITLPASPTIGQVVGVQQGGAAGQVIIINAAAGDTVSWGGNVTAAGKGLKTPALTTVGTSTSDNVGCYVELEARTTSSWYVRTINFVPIAS